MEQDKERRCFRLHCSCVFTLWCYFPNRAGNCLLISLTITNKFLFQRTMHLYFNSSTFSFAITKKRVYYAFGFMIFLVLFFSIRSKYFERSDFLRPVTRTIKNTAGRLSKSWQRDNNDIIENIMDDKFGNDYEGPESIDTVEPSFISPWNKWMLENTHLQSVGDIFNRCDNKTRKTIGKIVLEQDRGDTKVFKLLMLLNMTFHKDVTAGKAQMLIKYKGMVLHDYEYDLCEEVADLENPLYCPFKKGYELRLRNYVKLPSYIPKGHYVAHSRVTDQDGEEFGCIEGEVLTGPSSP